jgi:septal ring factor EnvC (AmiA/AmiB activator)
MRPIVLASDYDALKAELAEAKREYEEELNDMKTVRLRLYAERDALLEEVRRLRAERTSEG